MIQLIVAELLLNERQMQIHSLRRLPPRMLAAAAMLVRQAQHPLYQTATHEHANINLQSGLLLHLLHDVASFIQVSKVCAAHV